MLSQSKREIYLIFKTSLYDDAEVMQGYSYTPRLADVILSRRNIGLGTKMTEYISPPFCHVKIGIINRDKQGFDTYSFTKRDGFHHESSNYIHKHFSLVKLTISHCQYNIISDIINNFKIDKEKKYFSNFKMYLLGCSARYYTCMDPSPYPTLKDTGWTCSEFTCFCLQQAGILNPRNMHPSYCSPTMLFYELLLHKDRDQAVNPFFNMSAVAIGLRTEDTDAIEVYMKIMGFKTIDEIINYMRITMPNTFAVRFNHKNESVNQYTIFEILNGNINNICDSDGLLWSPTTDLDLKKNKIFKQRIKLAPLSIKNVDTRINKGKIGVLV
jgi:hypothetical protein